MVVFLIIIFIILQPAGLFADIYKYIDENGTICFTDSLPRGKKTKIIYVKKYKPATEKNNTYNRSSIIRTSAKKSVSVEYQRLAHEIASEYSLDPDLIRAVITAESNWDPFAVSKKGAMGLMQLMPATAQVLNVKNPYDPEENIRAGIRYLKYLLDKFNGDLILALAAYNAGPSIVERFGKIPPINETLQYVKKVLSLSGHNKNIDLKVHKRKKEKIYMIRLTDGSILYTNSGLISPH